MATRKSPKVRSRKTVRRHKSSTVGKILAPLDVNSNKSLAELKKRIIKGPLTIMLIYADWCGHCHHLMPHWDAAVKSPNRSIQAVKVNETMLNDVNVSVNKSINHSAAPIKVDGYPSIIVVDKKGNKVTDIQPVKDTTTLTNVMNKSASIANESGLLDEEVDNIEVTQTTSPKSINSISKMSVNSLNNLNKQMKTGVAMNNMELEPYSPKRLNTESESESGLYAEIPTTSLSEDIDVAAKKVRSIEDPKRMSANQKLRGGSLYAVMSKTAYTLAPAAALLATAAYVMKKKSHKSKKNNKRHRGTRQKKY
jgi:thiol-disulfide isomerase/thioredoxin